MTLCSKEAHRILLLSQMNGVGPAKLKTIMDTPNFSTMSLEQNLALVFKKTEDIEKRSSQAFISECESKVYRQLDLAQKNNVDILCCSDELFPKLLRRSKFNCGILYTKGNMKDTQRSAAVIGTRELPFKWEKVACHITETLIKKNFTIISGLAIGTDTVAHKTTVENHGRTVAVLAHGLDSIHPGENRELAAKIIDEGGALVSQYPIGTAPAAYNFAARDLIQEGLSEFVVMIASGLKGGSLIASRAALEDDRYLFIPKPFGDQEMDEKLEANRIAASGNIALIKEIFVKDSKKSKSNLSDPLSRLFVLNSREDYQKFDSVGINSSYNDSCVNENNSSEEYSLFG